MINTKLSSTASFIALIIAASFACVITMTEYYAAIFHPGSSTAGLSFLIMPIASIFIFVVIYLLSYALVLLVSKTAGNVRLVFGVSITIVILYLLFSIVANSLNPRNNKNYVKRKMTSNIYEAENKGVLVKALNYRIDSLDNSIQFHPYIERAFRYGDDTSTAEVIADARFPYRLGFNKFHKEDVFIFIMDEELNKFDSSAGSGLHGASGFLRNAKLPDTIHLGIRRRDVVLGSIKVWN